MLFATVIWFVATRQSPWPLGWIRMDEAVTLAEDFVIAQGGDISGYTVINAVEWRYGGEWGGREDNEWQFAVNPAVGYTIRFFRDGVFDGWTIGISPTGSIYKVIRQQLEDEPGAKLSQSDAVDLSLTKLATELGVPIAGLSISADTLIFQPQRTDWVFSFQWPDTFGRGGKLSLTLGGEAITGFSIKPDSDPRTPPPAHRQGERRVTVFLMILLGVFVAVQRHRTALALRSASAWGGIVFVMVIVIRGLSFPQAMLLIPADSPYEGFVARAALAAVVDALQSAILVGLVVATGEALWRDMLPRVPSFGTVGRGGKTYSLAYSEMVHRAARFALWAAAVMLVVETWLMHEYGPIGLAAKLPPLTASALSSPIPSLALPTLAAFDMVWDETLFRLWFIPLCMLLVRAPLAILASSLVAVYFAGYNLTQFAEAPFVFYAVWGIVAGMLAVRTGFVSALLFHLFVLGAHAAITMIWTGFGAVVGLTMLGALGLVLIGILTVPGMKGEPGAN